MIPKAAFAATLCIAGAMQVPHAVAAPVKKTVPKPVPKPARSDIGYGSFWWGMSPAQIASLLAAVNREAAGQRDPVTFVQVPTKRKNAKSYQIPATLLALESPHPFTAQFWFVKDRLVEYELRPQDEEDSAQLVGTPDALGYRDELIAVWCGMQPNWTKFARELRTDTVQARYKYSAPIGTVNVPVAVPQTYLNGNMMPVPGPPALSYETRTIYGTKQELVGQPLGFTLTQDDWQMNCPEGIAYFRIASLIGPKVNSSPAAGVVRLQARLGGGPWPFGTRRNYRYNNYKAIRKDIDDNYHVLLNKPR